MILLRYARSMLDQIFHRVGVHNKTVKSGLLAVLFLACCLVIVEKLTTPRTQQCGNLADNWTDQSWPNQLPSRQNVLLVTYGRSGSSFTSALISHHRDVFFLFEPLYIFNKLYPKFVEADSIAILESLMKCDIPAEHLFALNNPHYIYNGDAVNLHKCLTVKQTGLPHVKCFLEFLNECRNHSTWFSKTIRFRVKWAETFLETTPNFKLLYLVRDPRAALFSQAIAFRNFDWLSQIDNKSREHCSLVEDDLAELDRLLKLFPGRLRCIRYEDGAMDPFSYTRNIYKFLGLEYNKSIERYIQNITNSVNDYPVVHNKFSVVRQNSVDTMNKWRKLIDFTSVQKIDRICGSLYSKLGYRFVSSETDLKSVRSLVDKPQSDLFLE